MRHITFIGPVSELGGFLHSHTITALQSKVYRNTLSNPLPNVDGRFEKDLRESIEERWEEMREYERITQ